MGLAPKTQVRAAKMGVHALCFIPYNRYMGF